LAENSALGSRISARLALAAASVCVLSGCDAVPPELEGQWLKLQRAFIAIATGRGGEPGASARPAPSVSPSAELGSTRARDAKANAELLHEVYTVVYGREPKDRSEFGSLVDSMNQGASLEGMYNGFVHSMDYRRLEASGTSASPEALRAFGEELAILESGFSTPVEYDRQGAPLPPPLADGVTVIEYGKPGAPAAVPSASPSVRPSLSPQALSALAEKYSRHFVGTSIFTLKRLMGDEALRVIVLQRDYPEKLALWYSRWVVHMAARKVDYGISQRNQADEAFHYKWALTAGEDRIVWEVLNRVHRALNEANRPKQ
jgi:hypothetical protein